MKVVTKVCWPEVFTNPDFEYTGNDAYRYAIADGLSGWGCSYMETRPENFGQGMAKIAIVTKSNALPETLKKLANKLD